jgi:hypothetical protein
LPLLLSLFLHRRSYVAVPASPFLQSLFLQSLFLQSLFLQSPFLQSPFLQSPFLQSLLQLLFQASGYDTNTIGAIFRAAMKSPAVRPLSRGRQCQ